MTDLYVGPGADDGAVQLAARAAAISAQTEGLLDAITSTTVVAGGPVGAAIMKIMDQAEQMKQIVRGAADGSQIAGVAGEQYVAQARAADANAANVIGSSMPA